MLTGSCLCGAIHYQIDRTPVVDKIIFCHCSRCRKWNGSAFNVAMLIEKNQFQLLKGNDKIKAFSIKGINRFFCSACGSNLFTSRDNDSQLYRLRIGTLDTPIEPIKKIHIYTGSKANWDTICDDNESFSEGFIS